MEQNTETTRVTNVTLTRDEFLEMIKLYLRTKGVIDTEQHVTFKVRETRDDRGTELDIVLNNYNKEDNIYAKKELRNIK